MTGKSNEDPRTKSARENDDSELIDRSADPETPDQQGRSGGNLQTDVATQASEERVRDPDATEGVTKEDKIAHGEWNQEPRTGG